MQSNCPSGAVAVEKDQALPIIPIFAKTFWYLLKKEWGGGGTGPCLT